MGDGPVTTLTESINRVPFTDDVNRVIQGGIKVSRLSMVGTVYKSRYGSLFRQAKRRLGHSGNWGQWPSGIRTILSTDFARFAVPDHQRKEISDINAALVRLIYSTRVIAMPEYQWFGIDDQTGFCVSVMRSTSDQRNHSTPPARFWVFRDARLGWNIYLNFTGRSSGQYVAQAKSIHSFILH